MIAEPSNHEDNGGPPVDHGGTDGLQARETKSPTATTTSGTSKASATRALLAAAGENAVKSKEILITQIMKSIDPTLEIKSTIHSTLWSVPNEIPTFDRYKKHFA
eukprot:scaffold65712_cov64-Attheya_sp.AAC.1